MSKDTKIADNSKVKAECDEAIGFYGKTYCDNLINRKIFLKKRRREKRITEAAAQEEAAEICHDKSS